MTQGKARAVALPVAVARWFPNGEGWAYDASVDIGSLLTLLDDVLKVALADRGGRIDILKQDPDGWWIGVRTPDESALDPKVVHRFPSITRVAHYRQSECPAEELQAAVRNSLLEITPAARGPCDLKISVRLPSPVFPVSRGNRPPADALVRHWSELVAEGGDMHHFLAGEWRRADPDGTVLRRPELTEYSAGGSIIDAPRPLLLHSTHRILVAGLAKFREGRRARQCYSLQVYDGSTGNWLMLLDRSIALYCRRTGILSLFRKLPELRRIGEALNAKLRQSWARYDAVPRSAREMLVDDLPAAAAAKLLDDHWLLTLAWTFSFRGESLFPGCRFE